MADRRQHLGADPGDRRPHVHARDPRRPLGHAARRARLGLHPGPLVARRHPRGPHRASHRGGVQGPAHRHGAVHHLRGAVLLRLLLGVLLGRAVPSGDRRGLHLAARGRASGGGLGHPVPQHADPPALRLHGDLGAPLRARGRQPDRDQGAGADRGARHPVHQPSGLRIHPHHLQPAGLPDQQRDIRLDLLHGDRASTAFTS